MTQDFYPFVEDGKQAPKGELLVLHPARIAVYDDAAAAPRVVVVEPQDVRPYLEEITLQVSKLAQEQGGTIPFMVIREIVENFIHAYFMEPTISILDHGNTIRFSDQGPGISQKDRAMQYGTTSATEEMRRYIRGVGSGLPYVQQYMADKGGAITIADNMAGGTVVTLSAVANAGEKQQDAAPMPASPPQQGFAPQAQMPEPTAAWQQGGWPAQGGYPQQSAAYPYQGAAYPYSGSPYPSPAPMAAGWQQTPNAAWQQPTTAADWRQPDSPPAMQPIPTTAGGNTGMWPAVSARGRAVLDYLQSHDAVGPSDLARAYGESQPTWTRELQALEEAGLVRKDGQKRRLTAVGRSFLGA